MKFIKSSKGYGSLEYTLIIGLIIIIAIILLMWVKNKALMPSWLGKAQGAVDSFIESGPGGPVGGGGGSESGDPEDLGDEFLVAKFYQEFEDQLPNLSKGIGTLSDNSEASFDLFIKNNHSNIINYKPIDFHEVGDAVVFSSVLFLVDGASGILDMMNLFMEYSSDVRNHENEEYLIDGICYSNCYQVQITRFINVSQNKAEDPDYYTAEISFRIFDSSNHEIKSKIHKVRLNTEDKLDLDIFCLRGRLINVPEESKGTNFKILPLGYNSLAVIGHNKKLYIRNNESSAFELAEASKDAEISVVGEKQNSRTKLFASNKEVYRAKVNDFGQLEDFSKIDFEIPIDPDEEIIKIVDTFVLTNKYVYAYGSNPHGRLGTGDTSDISVLKKVRGVNGVGYMPTNIKKIETSFSDFRNTAILTNEGKVLIAGKGLEGAIGDGLIDTTNTGGFFVKPHIDESIIFIDIAHSASMTIALTNDNKLYVWGGGVSTPREFDLKGKQITSLYSTEPGFPGNSGVLAIDNEDKAYTISYNNNQMNDYSSLASNNFSYSIFNRGRSVEKKERVRLIDYNGVEESVLDDCLSIDKIYYFMSIDNYIVARMSDGKIRKIVFDVNFMPV